MSGFINMKDYDWKDSNVSMFGTDEDRKVKLESAKHEKHWEKVGKATEPFLFVWRIKQFNLVVVPTEEIGEFYNGDSYIVCKGSKNPGKNKLLYNIHFWIGKHSTQDEYGTAAYKTVELDSYLNDAAIQHREVEGYESQMFKQYFDKFIILKGGFESGFRKVTGEDYQPRLLQFSNEGRITYIRQLSFSKKSITPDDVFIVDLGKHAYQFNGSASSPFEKSRAAAFLQELESKRNGRCVTEVLDQLTIPDDHAFWMSLPDTPIEQTITKSTVIKGLYRVSDATGNMEITVVSEGKAPKSLITSDDVFMIQATEGLFVYIGKNCSVAEKRNALSNAHKHLHKSPTPFLPITVVTEENAESFLTGIWDE